MKDAKIADDLMALAQSSLDKVRQLLPQDEWTRFAIFVEACRIVDVLTVFGPMDESNGIRKHRHSIDPMGVESRSGDVVVTVADSRRNSNVGKHRRNPY